ncbi:glycosidase [Caulobacter segnis]|uniref:glycoside hydrolase family 130 protein n=1 Tax=Caulobacter segnis TaxID=88688 RepID=UPI00240F763F|nr:glycosidase [Caulobacter segnis]MDG2522274.1 glycosidase [Caulobacter segnis]
MAQFEIDRLVFRPGDVDLSRSPLRKTLDAPTFVLGAFNPALCRLPNGNLLLMVRVAEALRDPTDAEHVYSIRWTADGYVRDAFPLADANTADPRVFQLTHHHSKVLGLTSLSWLLPVELSPDGLEVVEVHYDRAIEPAASYQMYGVEDPRITRIDGTYYMTTCSVSPERHSTTLHTSTDGMDWTLQGIILDHQNKDMLFFEGMIDGAFHALTRPQGDCYFAYPPDSEWLGGASINLARSPDALHWRPLHGTGIRPRKGSKANMRLGGGAQPVRTDKGWLVLYHGVETRALIGIYRTFWALLDLEDPSRILRLEDEVALLEGRADLTADLEEHMYIRDVVFTTGIADGGDVWIVASGEADLACRMTHIPKAVFD